MNDQTTQPDVSWMAANIFVCFMAHSLGALALLVVPVYLFGFWTIEVSVPLVIVAAAIKEFFYDLRYEKPVQTFHDSLLDFVGYMAGLLVAIAIVAIGHFALGRP